MEQTHVKPIQVYFISFLLVGILNSNFPNVPSIRAPELFKCCCRARRTFSTRQSSIANLTLNNPHHLVDVQCGGGGGSGHWEPMQSWLMQETLEVSGCLSTAYLMLKGL